jgi:hypothetical protein
MAESPEANVLLIRRNQPGWTEAQRDLLPDGIRDTKADHVLIEFKYSESVNQDVLFQALTHRYLYLKVQKLKPERLHTVIISSKTPSQQFRMDFGYQQSDRPGIMSRVCWRRTRRSSHSSWRCTPGNGAA